MQIVGGGYRENVSCPRCFSIDRERLIYLFLKRNKPNLFENKIRLLHVAAEKAIRKTFRRLPNIDYLTADLNSPLADIKMDITDINQNDNTFDIIICNHVLEHILDDEKAMSELFRVLKPGGFAILQVPLSYLIENTIEDPSITKPEDREKLFGQRNHVRIYGKDYKKLLEQVGFSVEFYDFIAELGKQDAHKYGLLKDEKIFLCQKYIVA
jgi:SAM-dependent methyltransferase